MTVLALLAGAALGGWLTWRALVRSWSLAAPGARDVGAAGRRWRPFGELPEPTGTGALGQLSPESALSSPLTPGDLLGPGS